MEENNEPEVGLPSHAIKFGAVLGIVTTLITYIMYAVGPEMLADWKIAIFLFIIILVAVCVFGIKYRNLIGGYIPFGKGFLYSFIFLVVAGLIGTIGSIVLYTVIDPE